MAPQASSGDYSIENLVVWQKAMDLVDAVYELSADWPRNEQFGLTNQARRSAVSVPSNIAEGHGRKRDGEFLRFISISYGSLMELKTQLMISERRKFSKEGQLKIALSLLDEVARLLHGLRKSLEAKAK